jgi:hypothetical protein
MSKPWGRFLQTTEYKTKQAPFSLRDQQITLIRNPYPMDQFLVGIHA